MRDVCPLRLGPAPDGQWREWACLKHECAWWNAENERCSVGVLAEWVGWMSAHVKELAKSVHQERAELLKTAGEL